MIESWAEKHSMLPHWFFYCRVMSCSVCCDTAAESWGYDKR